MAAKTGSKVPFCLIPNSAINRGAGIHRSLTKRGNDYVE